MPTSNGSLYTWQLQILRSQLADCNFGPPPVQQLPHGLPRHRLPGMFRCEATTATSERLTLYGHCLRPEDALRMVLEVWRHDGVAVASVKIWRGTMAKGKPVLTWQEPAR